MGGGGGRLVLAVAVRSLRQQRSAVIPVSSHALHLLESRLCIGQPWNSEICIDQGSISKNSSETWAFAAAGVMAYSQATTIKAAAPTVLEEVQQSGSGVKSSLPTSKGSPKVVFVLGGPGSGKGTQCQKIVDNYGFVHLSAGNLLRAEMNSGSENGAMIQNMIKEGKIVPSEVTVKLLLKAMQDSNSEKFLIDGFPRNDENRQVFERLTGITPEFILFFDCPEDEMQRRVLGRNQGREDDNKETMQKRLKVFADYSVPVVKYYEATGKVRKILATGNVDDIFSNIQPLFKSFVQKENEQERTQPIKQQSAQKSSEQSTGGNPALN